jgi:hypothetical protein
MSLLRYILLLLALLGFGFSALGADSEPSKEDQVKAAYIYNFIQFTDWPAKALPQDSSPLVVSAICGDSLSKAIENALSGKSLASHPIVYKRVTPDKLDSADCNVLIVCGDDPKLIDQTVGLSRKKNILTVGDNAEFCSLGGIIRFYKEDNFVRFEINVKEAEKNNLRISSKLLKLAKIYSK